MLIDVIILQQLFSVCGYVSLQSLDLHHNEENPSFAIIIIINSWMEVHQLYDHEAYDHRRHNGRRQKSGDKSIQLDTNRTEIPRRPRDTEIQFTKMNTKRVNDTTTSTNWVQSSVSMATAAAAGSNTVYSAGTNHAWYCRPLQPVKTHFDWPSFNSHSIHYICQPLLRSPTMQKVTNNNVQIYIYPVSYTHLTLPTKRIV